MEDVVNIAVENWWAAPALAILMVVCNLGRKWLTKKKN